MNARHPDDTGDRRRSSDDLLFGRSNFLRPAPRLRIPAVPTALLIPRYKRETMPLRWFWYPVLAIEVIGFLAWVGLLRLFGRKAQP